MPEQKNLFSHETPQEHPIGKKIGLAEAIHATETSLRSARDRLARIEERVERGNMYTGILGERDALHRDVERLTEDLERLRRYHA